MCIRDSFDTEEQLPHIRFTPYLSSLLQEIVGGETNPVTKAWKIYEYITTKVMYSFMRPYFTVENISEYAAVNLKGDCGVQAILFITLCRICLLYTSKAAAPEDIPTKSPSFLASSLAVFSASSSETSITLSLIHI